MAAGFGSVAVYLALPVEFRERLFGRTGQGDGAHWIGMVLLWRADIVVAGCEMAYSHCDDSAHRIMWIIINSSHGV